MMPSVRMLLMSSVLLLPSIGLTQQQEEPAASKKPVIAPETQAAMDACDKGAAVPLDFSAKAPQVQFIELMPADFDMAKLRPLLSACQQAWTGAPSEKRFELQFLRVGVALAEPGIEFMVPQIRKFADAGSAEAKYLLFSLYRLKRGAVGATTTVSRDEALKSLMGAAEQGHLMAMLALMTEYGGGAFFKRDPLKIVQMARRIESAPPQGIVSTRFEESRKANMGLYIATVTLGETVFSEREQRVAFRAVEDAVSAGDKRPFLVAAYIKALRNGLGTKADPNEARTRLEELAKTDKSAAVELADMVARGEGGPADLRRALKMLGDEKLQYDSKAGSVLGNLLLEGKLIGAQPLAAINALSRSRKPEDVKRLAALLINYPGKISDPQRLIADLAPTDGPSDPESVLLAARLMLSDNNDFEDVSRARALLKPLADAGNREAFWLYAGTQYSNLDSTSFTPMRRDDGLSDTELKAAIEKGIKDRESEAYLLVAKLARRGALYRQDDQGATNSLISAANLGNVEAMVLLGEAYDEGIGIAKDPRMRLFAWREAAKRGSLKARKKLGDAFTFDSFDKLMTLEEGVTGPLVLYFNGYGRRLGGIALGEDMMASMELGRVFSFSSRAMDAGNAAIAGAVMNAFREAPAGLEEKTLVTVGKAMPDEIRQEIEKVLVKEGFYKGNPDGYFGPEVREALVEWVWAKGPAVSIQPVKADSADEGREKVAMAEKVEALRKRLIADINAAKTNKQRIKSTKSLNELARYGDMAARWGLMSNYDDVDTIRAAVTPAEITRYGLDVVVSKPAGIEKADFEFTFTISRIFQDGKMDEFGAAVIDAIRDDARMQDPLMLGGVFKQFIFAPGACDAILSAGRAENIAGMGNDGCDEASMTAVIEHAKRKGPAGVDAAARKEAAATINAMK